MREVSYTPRKFDPDRPTGSSLTIGSVAKISNAVAAVLADIAALNTRLDALEKAAAPAAPLLISEAQQ
jgi:hypothetical protein